MTLRAVELLVVVGGDGLEVVLDFPDTMLAQRASTSTVAAVVSASGFFSAFLRI